jgi:hypothetical protein
MIQRIGINGAGDPLVLAGLSDTDRGTLARILALAEQHLDDIPFPNLRSRRAMAEKMIRELREAGDLPKIAPQPATEDMPPYVPACGRRYLHNPHDDCEGLGTGGRTFAESIATAHEVSE